MSLHELSIEKIREAISEYFSRVILDHFAPLTALHDSVDIESLEFSVHP